MVVLVRKNRLVENVLVNQRGELKTDQVKLPANALRVTGVNVVATHLQVAPGNVLPRYYYGANALLQPTPAMIITLPTDTFNGITVDGIANATADKYLYYAHPIWLTNPIFNFGGFSGGFLNFDVLDLATPEGILTFRIWRSLNANLGQTTVHIVH